MADLANCKNCGRLYVRVSSPYCPECLKEQEKKFELVYDFIRRQENRTSTVQQTHEATGVETDLIYEWVREGRLQSKIFPNLGYPCQSCGRIIQSGILCDSCRTKIEKGIALVDKIDRLQEDRQRGKTYHTK
ncbi:hypothetical protein EWI07_01155 [Sporolactobacillus sp. THM7-4]|nr:hypothetical protein EWI07_01155 [Sporolactobacillus sp. THM7-4]